MKLGIALVPCSETIHSIVELQKRILSIIQLRPQLGTDVNLPHVTLLQGRFREPIDWLSLLTDLQNYCQIQEKIFSFEIDGIEYKPPSWYFLKLSYHNLLFEAHKLVFERLKSSMFLTEKDFHKDTSGYSYKEKLNYLTYGYRYIEESFQPHLSLGKVNIYSGSDDLSSLTYLLESWRFKLTGYFHKVTVYAMGDNGSHAKILHYLNL